MTTSAPAPIQTRRMAFEPSLQEVPRHFGADGDLLSSHIAACLSSVFPDGEDFFVRSVRRFRDQVTDPVLKQQVNGFIGQEAIHGREHRALNHRFADLGYPTRFVERVTERILAIADKVLPAKACLAATAALEHYTATLAEQLLRDDDTKALFGDPRVLDVFLWHALEESEHKTVAFDVYRTVGGTERMRRVVMDGVTIGFIGGVALIVGVSLLTDRAAYNPVRLARSLRRLRHSPIISKELWRELRSYNEVGFHPSDRDATELLERWREVLFGAEGSLNDRLAGVA
ncbi:MAG TPA: metal-dependent hydrolase [Acidimicrobiales bacterium]|nr:metal-dependent hydrolase [Acidimicrobiales bacterium]